MGGGMQRSGELEVTGGARHSSEWEERGQHAPVVTTAVAGASRNVFTV